MGIRTATGQEKAFIAERFATCLELSETLSGFFFKRAASSPSANCGMLILLVKSK
jgi:hypothetical protein